VDKIKIINRILEIKNKYGTKYLLSLIVSFALRKLKLFDAVQLHKERISCDAKNLFGNQVAYGIFKGMKFSNNVWWGKYDVLAKYLGQYEAHVLNKLEELSSHHDHFIDIGAADGYYAVGLLHAELYKSATCFEISPKGRTVIAENAELNNLGNRVIINGEANIKSLKKEIETYKSCVLLCDIEGAEFDLFSKECMSAIRQCTIIIELHDEFIFGDKNRRKRLINDAKEFFNISFIKRSNPKVNEFEEISHWNDDIRQLAFSEWRPSRMHWILLTPH
jgi:hypothetical protein